MALSMGECEKFFDSYTSGLKLQEKYLVSTYVVRLEPELVKPVHLFKLRMMQETRSLARMQEIMLMR